MTTSPGPQSPSKEATPVRHGTEPRQLGRTPQLSRWGGAAGLAGVVSLVGSVVVVVSMGLPDASDAETLTDFADIESGRIAEHLLYLGALVFLALHTFVLQRLLSRAHPPAALFGAVVSGFGLVAMAASSLLHVSTAPLAELYTAADATPDDQRMIEYVWHGAQSVFDTMLTTGMVLVPIGIILFGLAMRSAPAYGARFAMVAIGLGVLGIVGALIEVVDTSSDIGALSVLAMVLFHLVVGWRTFTLGDREGIDLTDREWTPGL